MSRINVGQDDGKGHLSVPSSGSDKSVMLYPKCDDYSVHIHTSPLVSPSICATHPEPCGAKTDILCGSSTLHNGLDVPSSSFTSSGNAVTRTIYSITNIEDPEEDRPGVFDYSPCHSDLVKTSATSRSEDATAGTKTKSPIPDLAQKTKSPTPDLAHKTKSLTPDSARKTMSPAYDSVYSKTSGTQKDSFTVEDKNALLCREASKHANKHSHSHRHSSLMHTRKHSDGDSDGEDEEESCGSSSFSRTYCSQVDEAISYNLIPSSGVGMGSSTHRFTDFFNLYRNPHFSEVWREKEKKNGAKDDSDKPDLTSLVDVNGNRRLLDPVTYLQMRQFPGDRSELVSPGGLIGHPTISISHSHSGPASSSSVDFDRRKERRRLKLERLKGKPAEEYKGYRKFKDIKEILEFVEGSKASFKAEGKIQRNKQERGSRKKEPHSNGPLEAESFPRGDDTESRNNFSAVISNSQTMGNSFGRSLAESDSKTGAAEEDLDKSHHSDFHTCLNSLSSELVITDKEHAVVSVGLQKSREKIKKVGDAMRSTPKPVEEDGAASGANFHKNLTNCDESVNKKAQKNKHRKEKLQNSVDCSPKSNVVKTSKSLEIEDVFLQTSIHSEGREIVYEPEREVIPDQKQDFFTEVKKKKKRAGGKDIHAAPVNHFPNHRLQNKRSLSRPSRYRSHTPPLIHSGNVISSVDDSFSYIPVNRQIRLSRDLSPSSFPVLSGHNSLTLRAEARRNSCGDLNSESVDNKTYDSDQESAKSLPDACGVGETLPTFPVSYARIAAATPRRSDTADSPSFESGVSSWSQKSSMNSSTTQTLSSCTDFAAPQSPSGCSVAATERKATIWKGSPRERRHSIGSSPDDKVDTEKSGIAQSSRQCGSQEVISKFMSSSIAASKDEVTPSAPLILKQDSSLQSGQGEVIKPVAAISDAQESPDPSLATKLLPENRGYMDHPLHDAESVSCHSHSTFMITASAQENVLSSVTQTSSSSLSSSKTLGKFKVDQNGASAAINVQHFSESSITQTSSPSLSSSRTQGKVKLNRASTAINIQPVSESSKHKTRSISNSAQKISKTKSVIFLDKRFNALPPQDFGITFGFDSSFEPPSDQPSLSSRDQSKHSAHSQLLATAAPSLPTQPSVPNPGASSQGISNIPSSSETANTQTLPNIPSCKFSDISSSHLKKGPHYPGSPNGLITPLVFSGNGPATSSGISGNGPAMSSVLSGNQPSTSSILSGKGPVIQKEHNRSSVSSNIETASSDFVSDSTRTSCVVAYSEDLSISSQKNLGQGSNPEMLSPSAVPSCALLQGNNKSSICDLISVSNNIQTSSMRCTDSSKQIVSPLAETAPGVDFLDVSHSESKAQESSEPPRECKSDLKSGESNVLEFANPSQIKSAERNPASYARKSEAKGLIAQAADDNTSSAQQPKNLPEVLQLSVVYGLKIKPSTGCGKLLFITSDALKNRGNGADVASFLRKRWSEHVLHRKGPSIFQTYTED